MKFSTLLLCSGTSSRMKPLSDKIFFSYLGKTILQRQIENILQTPTDKIFLVCNQFNKEKIQKICKEKFSKEYRNEKFIFTLQKKLSDGMKGGVKSVENFFNFSHSMLVISSNDIVENWYLPEFIKLTNISTSDTFLCGKIVEKYFPGGYLSLEGEKKIIGIKEKPGEGKEPSNMINLVIHFFKTPKKLFNQLDKNKNSEDDAYEKSLQNLFQQGNGAEVIPYNGKWQALKYPWYHLDMMNLFLSQIPKKSIHPSAQISKTAVINGLVIIEEGVKIYDFVTINGPVYIGKNSVIGNYSLIRNSHIGENCLIGGTEIARSYIHHNVSAHQSYIGDSVIDQDVNFGAGTRTGNLRFDEKEILVSVKNQKIKSGKKKLGLFCGKGVRIGINSGFLPGIKVGKDSFISPHSFIETDIEENSFIIKKNREEILERRENKINKSEKNLI